MLLWEDTHSSSIIWWVHAITVAMRYGRIPNGICGEIPCCLLLVSWLWGVLIMGCTELPYILPSSQAENCLFLHITATANRIASCQTLYSLLATVIRWTCLGTDMRHWDLSSRRAGVGFTCGCEWADHDLINTMFVWLFREELNWAMETWLVLQCDLPMPWKLHHNSYTPMR